MTYYVKIAPETSRANIVLHYVNSGLQEECLIHPDEMYVSETS